MAFAISYDILCCSHAMDVQMKTDHSTNLNSFRLLLSSEEHLFLHMVYLKNLLDLHSFCFLSAFDKLGEARALAILYLGADSIFFFLSFFELYIFISPLS